MGWENIELPAADAATLALTMEDSLSRPQRDVAFLGLDEVEACILLHIRKGTS